jgi:hypothetical protein
MSQHTLRLTQFTVQKLQRVGGGGRVSPYQITTYRGPKLGLLGVVPGADMSAANAARFEQSWRQAGLHWIRNRVEHALQP